MRTTFRAMALLALAACATARPEPTGGRELVQRVYDFGLRFGETRTAIRSSLGEPLRVDTALAENRHVPAATDTLYTLVYDGLRFELNRPGPMDRDLLVSVTLSSAARELPGDLGVGSARNAVTGRLGPPDETRQAEEGTVLAYRAPATEVDQFVEFVVTGDAVSAVRWVPYVD